MLRKFHYFCHEAASSNSHSHYPLLYSNSRNSSSLLRRMEDEGQSSCGPLHRT